MHRCAGASISVVGRPATTPARDFFLSSFELDCVEVREIFLAESRRSSPYSLATY
jgi:hypothetical protein